MANPKRASHNRPATQKKNPWLRVLTWFGVTLLSLGLIGAIAFGVLYATVKIPDPNADFQTNTTFVYYQDGKNQLGSFQIQNRQSIAFADMNPHVTAAIVAAENRTFWTDPGISIPALFRAVTSVIGPEQVTGGSTITQQYIKVLYLSQEKTLSRKVKEIILAAKMGQQLSKEQILEGYLNTVYFGRGAYGIEAASLAFFDKPSAKLNLAQSVALAAIVNSPGNLDPHSGDKQAADLLERYQYTLNGMVELGTITEAQRAEIYDKLPKFPKIATDSKFGGPKGFLLKMVETELAAAGLSPEQISGGGLKVVTTFDADAQDAVVKAAQQMTLQAAGGNKKSAAQLHAGIASIDNATGGVLALYGGADYVKNSRNWATTTSPTGSTFKPYALTAALREGWTLNDRLDGNTLDLGGGTVVHNAGGANYGSVNLLTATTKSINTAYVDLTTQLAGGPEAVLQAANDAGAPTVEGWDPVATAALGTPEVSPLYQAAAYSTFANQGERVTPHVVSEVLDPEGRTLYSATTTTEQTIEADVATDVTYALSKVAQDGTGSRASALGYPVAGKTGTAYYSTAGATKTVAAWFVGFTRQITTSVMYVRGDEGNADLGNSFYGSGYPAMTWLAYMQQAMDGKESLSFDPPTDRTSTHTPTSKPRDTKKSDGSSSSGSTKSA
ncbi:MAG: transglycosylase domain-containing protein [Propionicimonas sp.]